MKLISLLDRYFEEALAVVLFTIILLIGMEQVFTRYLFSFVHSWAEELMRILFVALSLVSFSLFAKKNQHVKVEILTMILPPKVGKAVSTLASFAFLVFTLLVVKYTYDITVLQFESGQTTAAMEMATWKYFALGPALFLLMALRIVQQEIFPVFFPAKKEEQVS